MSEDKQQEAQSLCDKCQLLLKANRHSSPHDDLIQSDFKAVKSMFGSVDEYYYQCKVCGKEWLHETGSYGQGWQ